jgi:hypothetical protein
VIAQILGKKVIDEFDKYDDLKEVAKQTTQPINPSTNNH